MSFNIDNEIIEKIKAGDNKTLASIYDSHYPVIEKMVMKNNGNNDDAKDIFQEALIVLIKKVKSNNFALTSSLKTYIYSISRNLWLKKLRDSKPVFVSGESFDEIPSDESENILEEQHDTALVKKWLLMISDHCRNLIRKMFFENTSLEKIMLFFGYKNKQSAANQKYKCLEQVRKAANFS